MNDATHFAINRQRIVLQGDFALALLRLAERCAAVWPQRAGLEYQLKDTIRQISDCVALYVLNSSAVQITANIAPRTSHSSYFNRNRSQRPYLAAALRGELFTVSAPYPSAHTRRPLITAVRQIRDPVGACLGLLCADFDLRSLPFTAHLFERQPTNTEAQRPRRGETLGFDSILGSLCQLMIHHGVFQAKLHFSSARATLWLIDYPYHYHLLDVDDFANPALVLDYQQRPYPMKEARIPFEQLNALWHHLYDLSLMDSQLYLHAGMINIFNGMVELDFSCDSLHYIPWRELFNKPPDVWLNSGKML